MQILSILIIVHVIGLCGAFQARGERRIVRSPILNGKKEDLDEQWRIQQEILSRRKNPRLKAAQEEKVEKRRKEASIKVSKNFWNKRVSNDEDPLEQWKAARDRGEVKDFGYPDEPPKEASLFGVNIPIPSSPIDVPKYDNGERFDLRLPYAERGYVSEDADVMGSMSRAVRRFFGGKGDEREGGGE